MRRSGATINLLLAAGVVLVVASVFVFRGGGSSNQTPASARSVADTFANAYVRYLGGQIPLRELPNADAGVLRTADGIVVPPRLRPGGLTLAQLAMTSVSASRASAVFDTRDGQRYLPTAITLSHRAGTWEVIGIVPPDFSELDARPKIPPAPSAAQSAASTFALAYVDYREGARKQPPAGQALIARQIASGQDPLAHTAPTHAPAHLDSLKLGPVTNGSVAATAQLSDGGSSFTVLFTMQKGAGPWMASQFILSG
jgi:hypothetical protein